MSIATWEYF